MEASNSSSFDFTMDLDEVWKLGHQAAGETETDIDKIFPSSFFDQAGPEIPYEIIQHPSVSKKVLQFNHHSRRLEIVRGQDVLLKSNHRQIYDDDFLVISLQHSDLQYKDRPILACAEHAFPNLDDRPFNLSITPQTVTPQWSQNASGHHEVRIRNMNEVSEVLIKFSCFASEKHNGGNKEAGRHWSLHLQGSVMGAEFTNTIALQVVVNIRPADRLRKTAKRKLEAPEPAQEAKVQVVICDTSGSAEPGSRANLEEKFLALKACRWRRNLTLMSEDLIRLRIGQLEEENALCEPTISPSSAESKRGLIIKPENL